MNTVVIAGGNNGFGLHVAYEIPAAGHPIVLLGRDKHKGVDVKASFGAARDRADFPSAAP